MRRAWYRELLRRRIAVILLLIVQAVFIYYAVSSDKPFPILIRVSTYRNTQILQLDAHLCLIRLSPSAACGKGDTMKRIAREQGSAPHLHLTNRPHRSILDIDRRGRFRKERIAVP